MAVMEISLPMLLLSGLLVFFSMLLSWRLQLGMGARYYLGGSAYFRTIIIGRVHISSAFCSAKLVSGIAGVGHYAWRWRFIPLVGG